MVLPCAAIGIHETEVVPLRGNTKKSWFEAWCTMDARPTSKGSAGADHSGGARTHIKNRAATPYGKNDIPPFDDTTGEPIGEGVYEKLPKRKASSSRSSSGAKKRSSSAKGGKKIASNTRSSDIVCRF